MSKLKELRKKKGLTQKKLAEISNINLRTLQDYEIKRKSIDGAKIKTLLKLCISLNCELADILEDEETVELSKKLR